MRWIMMLTLLFATLTARADGFAYGKGFQMLHETDQLAVIDLDEEKADVSMYIAIDGIPAGETITYVLPFWYRPDDFSLQEMAPADYRAKYVEPAHEKVVRMNRIADDRGSGSILTSAAMFGLGFAGPFVIPTFGTKGRMSGSSQSLSPYAVHLTAHASAELYKVQAKDLRQLVAQAGLPAEYAEPLKKYKTSFFAVMRLTGPKREKEKASIFEGAGVCYRFQHTLPPEKRGEYVYPLGTGAAWPKPILHTEVFVTCPDRFMLQVTAPEGGTATDYRSFNSKIRNIYYHLQMTPEERKKYWSLSPDADEKTLFEPVSTHLLSEDARAPSAWHVAYLNSNPDDDIRVRLAPREAPWRLAVADAVARPGLLSSYIGLVTALLGWLIAGLVIIRPRWNHAGKPGSLIILTVKVMITANIWVTLGLIISGFIIAGLTWLVPYTANPVLPGILIILVVAVMLAVLVFYTRRWVMGPPEDWRHNLGLFSWLLATAIYLALNGGLYAFLRWCEAAV